MKNEKGFALIVTLILLTAMSLISVTMIKMNAGELGISYNDKVKKTLNQATNQAIERAISEIDNFSNPKELKYTINGYNIVVHPAECIGSKPLGGFSASAGALKFEETHWRFVAEGEHSFSGAKSKVVQGLRVRLVSNNCP